MLLFHLHHSEDVSHVQFFYAMHAILFGHDWAHKVAISALGLPIIVQCPSSVCGRHRGKFHLKTCSHQLNEVVSCSSQHRSQQAGAVATHHALKIMLSDSGAKLFR